MEKFILGSQNITKYNRPTQALVVLLSVMSLYFVACSNKNLFARLGYDLD